MTNTAVRFRFISLAVALAACGGSSSRYSRSEARAALSREATPGVLVGEFPVTKVSDGDTLHVAGLDGSLRLLGIDTEEIYHHGENRRAVEADWNQYLKDQRAGHSHPVKLETPLGEEAMAFAKNWFAGVGKVRVERDDPAEIKDRYNRNLAYVFARKNGTWVNYNVEGVRAGMAPYFTKYGYSRRFHAEFEKALAEAKAAKRGIWDPTKMHDPDYPEREAWWNARGEFMKSFRDRAANDPSYIDVTHWDATQQLRARLGKEVHVIGVVDDIFRGKGPTRVGIGLRGVPLIFFDPDVVIASRIETWKGEYVIASGTVATYENKHTHQKQLQIVVDRADQIELSPIPGLPPVMSPAASPAPAAVP
jgi:endonuclease YncB( thermonuclease family)